jgi:hypothetical protein
MKAGCILSAALSFLVLARAASPEPQQPPIKVCMCGLTVEGLEPAMLSAAITAIVAELKAMGVEVSPAPVPEPVLAEQCFGDPACLRESGENLGVDGILDVGVLRSGPMVRITFRLFASTTGSKLIETTTVAPYEDFPGTAPIARNLEPVLKTIRDVKPGEEATTAGNIKPSEEKEARLQAEAAAVEMNPPSPPVAATEPVLAPEPKEEPAGPVSAPVALKTVAPVPRGSPWKTWGWVAVGAGAVMLVCGAGTGGMALSLDGELADECGAEGRCGPGRKDDIDRLEKLALSTDILIGAGIASLAAGVLMLVLGEDDRETSLRIEPILDVGTAGASLLGRF